MAFNDLQPAAGPFSLAAGQAMRVNVWFGDPGDDHGAQWIMAHPLGNGQPPAELALSDFSKILDYEIGTVTENGPPVYGYDADSRYYRYGVTVTNWGSSACSFSVQGGGNT
jgi:hypothetical protein